MKEVSEKIKNRLKDEGYRIFDRLFELNIVGLRKANSRPGHFDDELHVFAKVSDSEWVHHVFNIVTDPGTYWMNKKGKPKNSLMLAQGQYKDSYAILQKSKGTTILKQINPVEVYENYDRKAVIDLFKGKKKKGLFSINFIQAKSNGKYLFLSTDMENAQVFQRKEDFVQFIQMCQGHEKLYGNKFTYTLLDERESKRSGMRKLGAIAGLIITVISTFVKLNKE